MKAAVTGAFGYSGRYITRRLLEAGHQVITLTNSSSRPDLFASEVRAFPLRFDAPERLVEVLKGTEVLINTYWVRFDHRRFTHAEAVANTRVLFGAAARAGVRRIVHVSITNPDASSDLPYFRGKAALEVALRNSGISHCVLRPTVLFGREDILINNIAWGLRQLPVFGVFGSGSYRLQPIYVDDLGRLAVEHAAGAEDEVVNATGPETYTYYDLVKTIREALGLRKPILRMPSWMAYLGCRCVGAAMRDVVVTREEIRGLTEERLWVASPGAGTTRLSQWLAENRESLGRAYASELGRRS